MAFTKGSKVKIGDKEYLLACTLAATIEITEKYKGAREMLEYFSGPAYDETDTPEMQAEKAAQRETAQRNSLREIPWLIALLANQGTMLEKQITKLSGDEYLSPERVAINLMPRDMARIMNAVNDALIIGNTTEHAADDDDKEVDVVLEEISEKNAVSAGA